MASLAETRNGPRTRGTEQDPSYDGHQSTTRHFDIPRIWRVVAPGASVPHDIKKRGESQDREAVRRRALGGPTMSDGFVSRFILLILIASLQDRSGSGRQPSVMRKRLAQEWTA